MLTALAAAPQRRSRLAANFQLFDDGAHGDGRAGDGLFSLPDSPCPRQGRRAFSGCRAASAAQPFVRSDPVPYNFQPLEVTAQSRTCALPLAGGRRAWYQIKKLRQRQQCFFYGDNVTVPEGWSSFWTSPPGDDGSEQFFGVCIPAGGTIERQLLVIPSGEFDAGPSLASGEVAVTFVERERGAISDSDAVTITRYREPLTGHRAQRAGRRSPAPQRRRHAPRSPSASTTALAAPWQDGTLVEIVTNLGTVEPAPVTAQ